MKVKKFYHTVVSSWKTFSKACLASLQTIPYGQTRNYAEQAMAIQQSSAYRTVDRVNGENQIVIVLPCHRIINRNGVLGGYGSILERKNWLLQHEKKYCRD